VAEKNDYDSEFLNHLQNQSVIFQREFENIHADNNEHFEDMRR